MSITSPTFFSLVFLSENVLPPSPVSFHDEVISSLTLFTSCRRLVVRETSSRPERHSPLSVAPVAQRFDDHPFFLSQHILVMPYFISYFYDRHSQTDMRRRLKKSISTDVASLREYACSDACHRATANTRPTTTTMMTIGEKQTQRKSRTQDAVDFFFRYETMNHDRIINLNDESLPNPIWR